MPAIFRFHRYATFVAIVFFSFAIGCDRKKQETKEKRPRPVVVQLLTKQPPPSSSSISASVASWKTEEIGFEVGGRVQYVLEPNTEVEGRVIDESGKLLIEGTPIGQIESERYQLAVALEKSDVVKAEQNLAVAEITLKESLPAQIAAAKATLSKIRTEYDRNLQLLAQNAVSQGEVDEVEANLKNAQAELLVLESNKKSQKAEIESLKNAILQSKQNLRDAERNLEDCKLFSSFKGQIADVSVVPGSVVSAGQPAITVQMMDPIKVEFEVSAEESRRLERIEILPVMVNMPDGTVQQREGYLYRIDPVADPLTRTYTVTLLVMNEKVNGLENEQDLATTSHIWRLDFKFLPGANENTLFAEEGAILQDDEGYYLWQVTNVTVGERPPLNGLLDVRKVRITPQSLKVPFLGNWVFQHVIVNDEEFAPKKNFIIGEIEVKQGTPETWNGDQVLLDSGGKWILRPGDLAKVNLSGAETIEGLYVPMDAIVRTDNNSYLFIVEEEGQQLIAKRIPIRIAESSGKKTTTSLLRIEPVDDVALEGRRYIVKGAHYMIDGEPVAPVSDSEEIQ
ncbi:efflux RND transporter periplasmic adaptor subunit [Rubinisphaera italica]|uniref:Putative efflux pump membrane fusion protein n=1 Tax=Rubinisphaera italica TaxID=2527969 RepID=A0A5C5XBI2_9PLAN|nr:HlyD family efflux transporter periplasmic adaptor subunit [Rubinisphaera italica]TWT60527.1 putative efflux pump membrane fusion protein [Rubinisphaera italica]